MMTGADLVKGALRHINAYQSGDTISKDDLQDALDIANELLESWSTDKNFVYGSSEYILQWIAGQAQYKIGNPTCTDIGESPFAGTLAGGSPVISGITTIPADLKVGATLTDLANIIPVGTTVIAIGSNTVTMSANALASPANGVDTVTYTIPGDFAIPRPLRITGGYTRINELDFTIDVYTTQDEYNAVLFKAQPGPWPVMAWYNNLMPYGVLNVYQTPANSGSVHLFVDTILATLDATTPVVLPQGYVRAFKWCLAKELWPDYWLNQPLPSSIAKQADESLKMIMALNAQPAQRALYDRALITGGRPDGGWITHGGYGR